MRETPKNILLICVIPNTKILIIPQYYTVTNSLSDFNFSDFLALFLIFPNYKYYVEKCKNYQLEKPLMDVFCEMEFNGESDVNRIDWSNDPHKFIMQILDRNRVVNNSFVKELVIILTNLS